MKKHPFFKALDSRVLDRYLQFGLRDTPTALYPSRAQQTEEDPVVVNPQATNVRRSSPERSGSVTLPSTKHQEAWPMPAPILSQSAHFEAISSRRAEDFLLSPDQDPLVEDAYIFVRPESVQALHFLLSLRPAVLWVYGSPAAISMWHHCGKKSSSSLGQKRAAAEKPQRRRSNKRS